MRTQHRRQRRRAGLHGEERHLHRRQHQVVRDGEDQPQQRQRVHPAFDGYRGQRQQQRDDQRDRAGRRGRSPQRTCPTTESTPAPASTPPRCEARCVSSAAQHRRDVLAADRAPRRRRARCRRRTVRRAPSSRARPRSAHPSAPACPTGILPTSSRSMNSMSSESSSSAAGAAADRCPSGASSRERQKALVHTRAMTYSVSRLVTTLPPTRTHASAEPFCAPASSSATLPMNPENGGMPPRLSAGTTNTNARIGLAAASPPRRCSVDAPAWRSISPTTRNSVVCTTMWWAT